MFPPGAKQIPDLYAVARITGCFGIKGFLKVRVYGDSPGRLNDLHAVEVGHTSADVTERIISEVVVQGTRTMVKFEGVENRTAAERFVGQTLFIEAGEVRRPGPGSYLIADLVGCAVWSTGGKRLGIIDDVLKSPGQDLWRVKIEGSTILIPAVREFIKEVDLEKKRVVVALIDGFIEE